jgi:hypothetical protein
VDEGEVQEDGDQRYRPSAVRCKDCLTRAAPPVSVEVITWELGNSLDERAAGIEELAGDIQCPRERSWVERPLKGRSSGSQPLVENSE